MQGAAFTQHYQDANEFFELFAEGDFDRQVVIGRQWLGQVALGNGKFETHARFVFDDYRQRTSGVGYIK